MTLPLVLAPEAEDDLEDAADFYARFGAMISGGGRSS